MASASLSAFARRPAATAMAWGVVVTLLLPAGVTVLDDDFGYYRSVVATLQHGRPWTDDWLEPWSASLSALSALFFKATGSFTFATHGLLAVLAAAGAAALVLLFRDRGLSAGRAAFATLLVLTFPTVLWKSVQFTGLALYLPCLFLAIWSYDRREWTLFTVVWILAIASRQSAVAWGILPLGSALAAWRSGENPATSHAIRRPALTLAAAIVAFAALTLGMNRTHSQAVLTVHVFDAVSLAGVSNGLMAGLHVAGLALGLGALASGASLAEHPGGRRWIAAVAVAILTVVLGSKSSVLFEQRLFDASFTGIYRALLFSLALFGWWRIRFSLRPELVVTAVASLALVCLRPTLWDYYLADTAAFLFFAAVAPRAENHPPHERSVAAIIVGCAVGLIALMHALFVLQMKATLDRAHLVNHAAETALRERRLGPEDIDFTTFGFQGWQLHPYYRSHEGAGSPEIAGFGRYLRNGSVDLHVHTPFTIPGFPASLPAPAPARDRTIRSARGTYLWFFQADAFLVRDKAPPAISGAPLRNFVRPPWPLHDAEWRQMIGVGQRP